MTYCDNCEVNVKGTKDFNWLIFLVLLGVGVATVGGIFLPIIYLIYYWRFKSKRCPLCNKEL